MKLDAHSLPNFNLNITQVRVVEIEQERIDMTFTNFCKDLKARYTQLDDADGMVSCQEIRNPINYFAQTSDNPQLRQVRH